METALARSRADIGADGYVVVHEVAASNLLVGNNVVVDAVNAIPEARAGWRDTAARCRARLIVLETVLLDEAEHRRRVESRAADIPGHRVPTWQEVQGDGWVPWSEGRDGPRTPIDTTSADAALQQALAHLGGLAARTTMTPDHTPTHPDAQLPAGDLATPPAGGIDNGACCVIITGAPASGKARSPAASPRHSPTPPGSTATRSIG